MERLTFEGNFCDIAQCDVIPGGSYCESGSCTQRKVWERLKAYEDTGLTPEEIKSAVTPDAIIKLAAQALETTPERLRELAAVDKDGRVVVLPCKVGDTVWRIVRDANPHITRDEVRDMYFADDMTLCVELVGGRITFTEKFGKTVFYTREEAERALEGSKDGN